MERRSLREAGGLSQIEGWVEGRSKANGLCFAPVFRPFIFLNTEHLNHMFGSIRESSGKHQPFHFYFQRELWVLDGGGARGRGGWAWAGQEGCGEEASCEDKPKGSTRGGSLGPRQALCWSETSPWASNACRIENRYLSDIINCIFPKFNIARRGKSFCLGKTLLPHNVYQPARFNCCDKNHKKDQVPTQCITTSTEE